VEKTKYKKVYELWRKRNPEAGRTWTQIKSYTIKKYIVTNKNITKMEIEDIKKELKENERRHLNESEGDQLEQLCTMNVG
jgi:hypothetical protein